LDHMESEKYQGELFELDRPKGPQRKLDSVFPKTKPAVTLSLERVVFISIGVIMLMVAFYALGVEKGKSNARAVSVLQKGREEKAVRPAPVTPPAVVTASAQSAAVPVAPTVKTNIQIKAPAVPAVQDKVQTVQPAERSYAHTIVAATFTKRESASLEADRLRADKFDAFVIQRDPYFLVCVGAYTSKDSASKTLPKVRQRYKDAYIKSQ